MKTRVRSLTNRPQSAQQQWDRLVTRHKSWPVLRDCLVVVVILALLASIVVPRIIA